jgi:hypothetical protein
MTNLDPQTTADFWDAYLRAADAGTNRAQVCPPVSVPASYVPRIASAAITFAWDRVLLRAPIAADAPPRVA